MIDSSSGASIRGYNTSTGQGVYGMSTSGEGMRGVNSGTGNFGLLCSIAYGRSGSSNNWGYVGGGAYGVYGKHDSSGNYGYLGGSIFGGYFQGDGYFSGDVGIGTASPTAELDVLGTIRMQDGNEADGKLMVSDVDGNATWKKGRKYTLSDDLNINSRNTSSTWTKMDDFLTFTKDNAATDIEVVMNTRADAGTFAGGATGVEFEIRIDGSASILSNNAAINISGNREFLSIIAVFEGLSAGTHTVSVWIQTNVGTSSGVLLDPGGWGGRILVKEVW